MSWVEDQEIEAFNAILDADLGRIEELHYSSGLPTDCILFAVVTKRIDLIKLLLEWGYCWDEDFFLMFLFEKHSHDTLFSLFLFG